MLSNAYLTLLHVHPGVAADGGVTPSRTTERIPSEIQAHIGKGQVGAVGHRGDVPLLDLM
jgi:hypothetical protein